VNNGRNTNKEGDKLSGRVEAVYALYMVPSDGELRH
jgi:hypothetical protein